MPRKPPVRRFVLLCLVPAVATCAVLVQLAQETRDARRDAILSRLGGMLAVAVQTELAEAWTVLEAEAAAVRSVDTSLVAVRRALAGDTIRSLATTPGGPSPGSLPGETPPGGARASVLLPRGDTLVSATAIIRSPTIAALADVAELDAGLYLRGTRLQTSAGPAAAPLPDALDPVSGWSEAAGLWVTPATASGGSAAGELVVAVRSNARRRSVASPRTLLASTVLLALALALVVSAGATGRSAPGVRADGASERDGRIVAGAVLAVLTTAVVAGWAAVGEHRLAAADGARELSLVAELVDARGLLGDPGRARGWSGGPVYRIEGERLIATEGDEPPAFVGRLPSPDPDRPVSGSAVGGIRWLVVASDDGRTVFLGEPTSGPPLLPFAFAGTLLVVLGSVLVTRPASVQDVLAR